MLLLRGFREGDDANGPARCYALDLRSKGLGVFKSLVREGELRRWAPWVGVALLILICVAVETSMEAVCWDKKVAEAAKINEAAGCFEFWFNRYQTLIGAAAAIGAAWYAGMWVSRQVERTDKQIILAQAQMGAERLPYLEGVLRTLSELIDHLFICHDRCASVIEIAEQCARDAMHIAIDYKSHLENRAVMIEFGLYTSNEYTIHHDKAGERLGKCRAAVKQLASASTEFSQIKRNPAFDSNINVAVTVFSATLDGSILSYNTFMADVADIIDLNIDPDESFPIDFSTWDKIFERDVIAKGVLAIEAVTTELTRVRLLRDQVSRIADEISGSPPT